MDWQRFEKRAKPFIATFLRLLAGESHPGTPGECYPGREVSLIPVRGEYYPGLLTRGVSTIPA